MVGIYVRSKRLLNLSPGPADLPTYLKKYRGVWNQPTRGKDIPKFFDTLNRKTRDVLNIPDNFELRWMHGGAVGQFSAIPMNLNAPIHYNITGYWSKKAARVGEKHNYYPIGTTKKYEWVTSNETVEGIRNITHGIVDATSDVLSYPVRWNDIDLFFASGGKNLGLAGFCLVVFRPGIVDPHRSTPDILNYQSGQLVNTPPLIQLGLMDQIMSYHIKYDLDAQYKENRIKAATVYDAIKSNPAFTLTNTTHRPSIVSIPFVMDSPSHFFNYLEKHGITNAIGHPSVGGARVSLYNHVSLKDAEYIAKVLKYY